MVKHWNMLPKDAVKSPSLQIFKSWIDKALSNLI